MFQTDDLYLGSALIGAGHRLADVTREGHRARFHFEDSPALRSTVAEYYAGRLSLKDALNFSETLRSLKSAAVNVTAESRAVAAR